MTTTYKIDQSVQNISFDVSHLLCLQKFEDYLNSKIPENKELKWAFEFDDKRIEKNTFSELFQNELFQTIGSNLDKLLLRIVSDTFISPMIFLIKKNFLGNYYISLDAEVKEAKFKHELNDFFLDFVKENFSIKEQGIEEQIHDVSNVVEESVDVDFDNKPSAADCIKVNKSSISIYDKLEYKISSYFLTRNDFLDLLTIIFQNFPEDDIPKIEISITPIDNFKKKNKLAKTQEYNNLEVFLGDKFVTSNIFHYMVEINISTKICKINIYLRQDSLMNDRITIHGDNETFCQGKYYAITEFFKTKKPWHSFLYSKYFSAEVILFLLGPGLILFSYLSGVLKKHPSLLLIVGKLFVILLVILGLGKLLSFILPKRKLVLQEKNHNFVENPIFQQSVATIVGTVIATFIIKAIF